MRQGSLSVLFALCLLAPTLQAQEPESQPVAQREIEAEAEQHGGSQQVEASAGEASAVEKAQVILLREENQRLKDLLQQQQTKLAFPLLNDEQQWFAVGGGVGVLGFLLGVLATRGRRRRQWLN